MCSLARWFNYTFLTQRERDNETGLDYSINRYYSSTQGRFTSPDPMNSSGIPLLPQSWNRYSYTINNPLLYTDPEGLIWDGMSTMASELSLGMAAKRSSIKRETPHMLNLSTSAIKRAPMLCTWEAMETPGTSHKTNLRPVL